MIGFVLGSILMFLTFMLFSFFHYHAKWSIKYSIANMFPFELNYRGTFGENFFGNISYILSLIATGAAYFLVGFNTTDGIKITIMIFGFLQIVVMFFILFVSTEHLKVHLLCDALFFVFEFVVPALFFVGAFRDMQNSTFHPLQIAIYVMSGVALLATSILILNPRLTTSLKMETKTNEKGEEIKTRPRFIVLALSEWILMFIHYLNLITAYLFILLGYVK